MHRTGSLPHDRCPHRSAARSRPVARVVRTALLLLVLLLVASLGTESVGAARGTTLDPGALPRGPDPALAHLVHGWIRDGEQRVRAPLGHATHQSLWPVEDGYVVRDVDVGVHHRVRVRYVAATAQRSLVTPTQRWVAVAVSSDGRQVALQEEVGASGVRSRVTVVRPATGRVLGSRTFRLASLVAVTGDRVLLGRRTHWRDPATVWWTYRGPGRDRLHRIHDQAAVRADVVHDRVVLSTSPPGEFCLRVAELSRPTRTLWRSCRLAPHQWSPDGAAERIRGRVGISDGLT